MTTLQEAYKQVAYLGDGGALNKFGVLEGVVFSNIPRAACFAGWIHKLGIQDGALIVNNDHYLRERSAEIKAECHEIYRYLLVNGPFKHLRHKAFKVEDHVHTTVFDLSKQIPHGNNKTFGFTTSFEAISAAVLMRNVTEYRIADGLFYLKQKSAAGDKDAKAFLALPKYVQIAMLAAVEISPDTPSVCIKGLGGHSFLSNYQSWDDYVWLWSNKYAKDKVRRNVVHTTHNTYGGVYSRAARSLDHSAFYVIKAVFEQETPKHGVEVKDRFRTVRRPSIACLVIAAKKFHQAVLKENARES